jgi:hypothetical protein
VGFAVLILILGIITAYLSVAVRRIPVYARKHVEAELSRYPSLYRSNNGSYTIEGLRREAVWGGVGKALFWVWVDIAEWVTSRMVDSLTSEERKAKQIEEARKMIAEYDAEQAAKDKWDAQFNS